MRFITAIILLISNYARARVRSSSSSRAYRFTIPESYFFSVRGTAAELPVVIYREKVNDNPRG